jgi:hypothetical protein
MSTGFRKLLSSLSIPGASSGIYFTILAKISTGTAGIAAVVLAAVAGRFARPQRQRHRS